jgi:glycosyltransferase involved in cell wall biosynthesis
MSCNVPVITSNTSSMPEIAADAASHYNDWEITSGLIKILNNDDYKKSLCEKA